MANVLNGLFGGGKPADAPVSGGDSDFADFAEAPNPVPADTAATAGGIFGSGPVATPGIESKWYEVHKRHSIEEFKFEGAIIAIGVVIFIIHMIGSSMNRSRSKAWAKAHTPALKREFASVGFSGKPTVDSVADDTTGVLKEKSLFEWASYATGRQNAAFVDINLTLIRRFNPMVSIGETAMSFFFDSVQAPRDSMEATLYPFDGKESVSVPSVPGTHELRSKDGKSTFDGFIWAIVAKERMKELREQRYDLSLTFTKDNNKLPSHLSVMSESAEITELMLTPELIQALSKAGDDFDYLIISDQPVEKPKTIEEATAGRKRIFLRYGFPSGGDFSGLIPVFEEYLRLPDFLVGNGKLRPEVSRKINRAREESVSQLRKEAEAAQAEERAQERERVKKAKRDQELAGLDAKQQKKYLERERDKEQRKANKRQTMRA